MPKPHTVLAASVRSQRIPTERDILELAEMTSYVFDSPEAVGLKARLKEKAEVYRDWLQSQQLMKDEAYNASLGKDEQGRCRVAYGIGTQRSLSDPESVTFLLGLLFTCPQILSQPAGFEWVLQDLEMVLFVRRLDPPSDQVFENAINRARITSRVGPPKDKALESFRYATIKLMMNPSTVLPGVKVKKTTLKKKQMTTTKAVGHVAEIEMRLLDGKGGTRSIWTAKKRVKQFMRKLSDRVQATSSLIPPSTTMLSRHSLRNVRNTKKRRTPATHRTPPSRT
jgi:hypothetical protein